MTPSEKRNKFRKQYWPKEDPWTGEEDGWFKAPRTLPLLLVLLKTKALRGKESPATTYLELLSHHYGGGLIELRAESEHAHAAGFTGARAVRSWKERIAALEKIGFIKTQGLGAQKLKYVLLMHPVNVVERLRSAGELDGDWWETYRARQFEVREPTYEDRPQSLANVAKGSIPKVGTAKKKLKKKVPIIS
jgi:hypothetical protein